MRAEILTSVALALLVLSFANAVPSSPARITYQPGVHVGDWWKYDSIQCSPFCPPQLQAFQQVQSINSTVTYVAANNVTIANDLTFINGTEKPATLSGNLETGQGNLTYQTLYYVIAGGLVQGSPIHNSPMAPKINTTLTENILGLMRPVNILEVSNPFYTLEQQWDQASGILVAARLFVGVFNLSASIYLTDAIWTHTPDFTLDLSLHSDSLAIEAGETVNTTVCVQGLNGFKGPVNLTATAQPSGPIFVLEPSTLNLQGVVFRCGDFRLYGVGADSTLSISIPEDIKLGTYVGTITASNQTISHSVQLTITVTGPDFEVMAYPSNATFPVNWGNIAVTVWVKSLEGFTGQVSFSAEVDPTGLTASFANRSLNLLPNSSNYTYMILRSTTLGSYDVLIIGKTGSRTHTFTIQANVVPSTIGDFTVAAMPQHVIAGRCMIATSTCMNATSIITVTSVDNFSGDVYLDAQCPAYAGCALNDPFGPRARIGPAHLILTENSSSTATLIIQPGLMNGNYAVEIRATGRFLYHSLNVTFTISLGTSPPTQPPSSGTSILIFGLPPLLFYSIVGAVTAVFVSTVVFLGIRRIQYSRSREGIS